MPLTEKRMQEISAEIFAAGNPFTMFILKDDRLPVQYSCAMNMGDNSTQILIEHFLRNNPRMPQIIHAAIHNWSAHGAPVDSNKNGGIISNS